MTEQRINVGDRIVLTGTFRDGAEELADPLTVSITLRPPTGPRIVLEGDDVIRLSAGVYEGRYVVTEAGLWRWNMAGTGDIVAVEATAFTVFPA